VNLEGALTWAFEFEDQPCFAGFRSLASNGINKPVLNVFRMFSKMRGQRVPVESSGAVSLADILARGVRGEPDVAAIASVDGNKLWVLAWHYHDDDVPGKEALVELDLNGLSVGSGEASVRHFRIDQETSNAFTAWKKMGSPAKLNAQQYEQLEKVGRLAAPTEGVTPVENSHASLRFTLPRQAVSLIELTWKN
jgi:xylan 1,4-beta-xylosidase